MTIFRLIVKNKYPKIKNLKKSINNLKKEDKIQLEIAEDNDIVSGLNQDIQQEKSFEFELQIQKIFKKKGVKFETQEELQEKQKEEYGKSVATPDILLSEPIIINDKEVNWIEIKYFYGGNSKFMMKKIKKQVQKYKDRWGPGCLIFKYGVASDIKIDDVIIVSL